MKDEADTTGGTKLRHALYAQPLIDGDMYLVMQSTNLGLVDDALSGLEGEVLREYAMSDRTPPSAGLLSALSQLWIFGVYELLRTWRQRVALALEIGSKLPAMTEDERLAWLARQHEEPEESTVSRRRFPLSEDTLARIAAEPAYVESVRAALDRSEGLYRRIEALRVHLAKHEIARMKNSVATAPGYGRIDLETGSIYFDFETRSPQGDRLSRRDIADGCRKLVEDRSAVMLSEVMRAKMRGMKELAYGVKHVVVTTDDGQQFNDVFVMWDREVVGVGTYESIPFDARRIADVRPSNEQ